MNIESYSNTLLPSATIKACFDETPQQVSNKTNLAELLPWNMPSYRIGL